MPRSDWEESETGFLRNQVVDGGFVVGLGVPGFHAGFERAAVRLGDEILTEAKVIAFGVNPTFRRQGIGRRLQELLIERAKAAGCYQVRSHSSASNIANHQLKLSLGFAIHPLDKTSDRDGAYFILPLHAQSNR